MMYAYNQYEMLDLYNIYNVANIQNFSLQTGDQLSVHINSTIKNKRYNAGVQTWDFN